MSEITDFVAYTSMDEINLIIQDSIILEAFSNQMSVELVNFAPDVTIFPKKGLKYQFAGDSGWYDVKTMIEILN